MNKPTIVASVSRNRIGRKPHGSLAEAIRYALGRWTALTRFLCDGRIDLDTNPVERAIRPIALGRENSLFAGNDSGVVVLIDGQSWHR